MIEPYFKPRLDNKDNNQKSIKEYNPFKSYYKSNIKDGLKFVKRNVSINKRGVNYKQRS